jgi:hypothetical protein
LLRGRAAAVLAQVVAVLFHGGDRFVLFLAYRATRVEPVEVLRAE